MKPKSKLTLKKITVSNLADDAAKKIYGGDDATTFGPNCSISCAPSPCTVSKDNNQPGCDTMGCPSDLGTGCGNSKPNNNCFSVLDCSYAECTDIQATCPETYGDAGCGTDSFPSV